MFGKAIIVLTALLALQLQASAAEAGHQEALFWLGVCYWKGAGVPVDRDKARSLWEKSESVNAHHYLDYTRDGVNIDNDFGRLMTGVSSEDE